MPLKGIDISSWQPNIKVGNTDADFVFVKATEGDYYLNPYFHAQAKDTLNSGKLLGIYHFANGGRSPETEATFFSNAVRPYLGKAMLALDWEADALEKGPGWAKSFLDSVKKQTGVTPIIYMSKGITRMYDWSDVASTYGLWYAQYANYNPVGWDFNPWTDNQGTGAWKSTLIFQYTSSGRIKGYDHSLDLNLFYGTKEDWMSRCKTSSTNPDKPSKSSSSPSDATRIKKMIDKANAIADDNSHGYSQANRWSPDYDCSSMMYECANYAGYPVGRGPDKTRYTGTMRQDFVSSGFRAIPFNLVGLAGLEPGDILLNEVHHTEMYIGNGQFVGAHSNYDERTGDSSGQEISRVNAYVYSSGWDYVLRPPVDPVKPKEDPDLKLVTNTGGNVYRLVNGSKHLLTLSKSERDKCIKNGWKDEGIAFKAPKGGIKPVYRLFSTSNGDHMYTTDFKEATTLQKKGWKYEGVPFFGNEVGTTVARLYNPKTGQHHFTTDVKEKDTLIKSNGWKSEGTGWFV